MTPLFKKLNLKEGTSEIIILNAPENFRPELVAIERVITVEEKLDIQKPCHFLMAFVTQQQQVDALSAVIAKEAAEDAVIWFCYPKGTSKRYQCDFNRDTGWAALGNLGFEPVRMVAVDEDWSALRFRAARHIKKMTRSSALSEAGKKRIEKNATP